MDILAQVTEQDYTEIAELPIGFLFGSVKNVGDSDAIVNGVTLPSGQAKGYPFVGKGYQAVAFDPQESILRVMVVF